MDLKTNLHFHSSEDKWDNLNYSVFDGVDRAVELGFDVLALTCHNEVMTTPEMKKYAEKKGVLLISGAELNLDGADVLVLGTEDKKISRLRTLRDLREYKKENLYLFSNPAVPVGRTAMTIKTSFNNCGSWSNSKLVNGGPSAYSCLVKLPNGQVGLFFEAGEKRPYEKMVFVSFKIKELFTPGKLIDKI